MKNSVLIIGAGLAGLATGVVGTSIFLWQRRAAQRGARGAQTGLPIGEKRTNT